MIDLGQLTNLMEHRGVAQKADLVGVAEAEIQNLERHFGVRFPQTYRQFLQAFGRSAGFLSPWMAIYFDDLKDIRDQFDCLLAADKRPFNLPAGAVLIGNWESVFDYMVCGCDDDPPVYRIDLYQDEGLQPRLYAKSYSAYLENLIKTADTHALPSDFFEDEVLGVADDTIQF